MESVDKLPSVFVGQIPVCRQLCPEVKNEECDGREAEICVKLQKSLSET
jgi:hypothetical protein